MKRILYKKVAEVLALLLLVALIWLIAYANAVKSNGGEAPLVVLIAIPASGTAIYAIMMAWYNLHR